MVVQAVWLLPDGNVDSRKGLPFGGILLDLIEFIN
jgi:hypothetical protein